MSSAVWLVCHWEMLLGCKAPMLSVSWLLSAAWARVLALRLVYKDL